MDGGESGEVAGAEPVDGCADGDDANDARESVHTHAHDTQWTHAVRETPNQTSACVIELGRGCHAGREESFAVAVCGRCRRAVVIWRCARPSHPRPSRVTCWHGWVDTEGDVRASARAVRGYRAGERGDGFAGCLLRSGPNGPCWERRRRRAARGRRGARADGRQSHDDYSGKAQGEKAQGSELDLCALSLVGLISHACTTAFVGTFLAFFRKKGRFGKLSAPEFNHGTKS